MRFCNASVLLHLCTLFLLADAMFSKRPLPDFSETEATKRLRVNLVDLFASNIVSGQRAQTIFEDCVAAKALHFEDLGRKGSKHKQNHARDLQRRLLRKNKWPALYWARIRVFDPKRSTVVRQWVPLLLPHELLACLSSVNSHASLSALGAAGQQTKDLLAKLAVQFGEPSLLGFGLWGDGVPVNYDRSESVEVLSFNLPGLANFRIPITCISKVHVAKHHTLDDILDIVRWSAEHCPGQVSLFQT